MTIDASEELESLGLLVEVSDYLGRLPRHQMTYAMKAKIDKFLNQPGAKIYAERLAKVAKDRAWRERLEAAEFFFGSSSYGQSGAPVVDCLVLNGRVHLRSPAHAEAVASGDLKTAEEMAMDIGREVATGMNIQIGAASAFTKSHVLKQWPIAQ